MVVEQNIERLHHLLALYKMSPAQLMQTINKNAANPIKEEEIFKTKIKLSSLKKIDNVFEKGIHYYLDVSPPIKSKDVSIFFRKQTFGADLNMGAIKVVNQYEELKHSMSALAKSADIKIERKLPLFRVGDDPIKAADDMRRLIAPQFASNLKEYLRNLIESISQFNIYVFEFVETWNKKEKANIDGLFIGPNIIVIKRNQTSFRREIFTLMHELGHYLLNEEEIEEVDVTKSIDNISGIERWCNNFAYYFLVGEFKDVIANLDIASYKNDYHHDVIKHISIKTHLSKRAILTRMLLEKKITLQNYRSIINEMDVHYEQEISIKQKEKQILKDSGAAIHGSAPKPIMSPLFLSTLQIAHNQGIINDYEFCSRLKIKPENLENYSI